LNFDYHDLPPLNRRADSGRAGFMLLMPAAALDAQRDSALE